MFPLPVDLNRFPTIDDFAVVLSDAGDEGKLVEFASARGGRLAGFPAWEHAERDLRHFDATDVPIGSIEEPFEDADDEWRIIIFEHHGHVYVLEADAPLAERFGIYFRVSRDRYLQAWAAVISTYNPIEPV